MTPVYHIAILASGSGTNAEAIMSYFQQHPTIRVNLILTNKSDALVIARAKKFEIPVIIFSKAEFQNEYRFLKKLEDHRITHLVLAGFLWLIPPYLVKAFPNRIINIHPALLPKFGGKGMYGRKVHEAIKQANEEKTGITIHLVNEHYDEGTTVFQASCDVMPDDTVEDISRKVQQLEHQHYPIVIEGWIQKK